MNKKSIKKAIRFYLCSIIILSTTQAMSAEKKTTSEFFKVVLNENESEPPPLKQLIEIYFTNTKTMQSETNGKIIEMPTNKQNPTQPKLLRIHYNFSSLNTKNKYTRAANQLPDKKSTNNVTIKCDICNTKRSGRFYLVYKNMCIHRKNAHNICKYNKPHENAACNCKTKPLNFFLLFSSINTPKKYRAKLQEIGSKNVSIICDICPALRTGSYFPMVYSNMLRHRENEHHLCKYNEPHATSEDAKKCENHRNDNNI